MRKEEPQVLNRESDRQQLIAEFVADQGSEWSEQVGPGSFGCHELLDRTSIVLDLLERSVLSHPACVQDPEWFRLAEQASTALCELYQQVGEAHLSEK